MRIIFYNIHFENDSFQAERETDSDIDYPENWLINDIYEDMEIHGLDFLSSGYGKKVSSFNFRVSSGYYPGDDPNYRKPRYMVSRNSIPEVPRLLACELEDMVNDLGNDYHIVDSLRDIEPSYAIYKNTKGKEFFWFVDVVDEGLLITNDTARIKFILEVTSSDLYHYNTNDFPYGLGTVFNPYNWSIDEFKRHIEEFNCEEYGYNSLNPKWKI
jgi:hypothetical protein